MNDVVTIRAKVQVVKELLGQVWEPNTVGGEGDEAIDIKRLALVTAAQAVLSEVLTDIEGSLPSIDSMVGIAKKGKKP